MRKQSSFTLPELILNDEPPGSAIKNKVKKPSKKVKVVRRLRVRRSPNPLLAAAEARPSNAPVPPTSSATISSSAVPQAVNAETADVVEDGEEYEFVDVEEEIDEEEEEDEGGEAGAAAAAAGDDAEQNVPLASLSVHPSLERLVDRITEIKSAPWTNFNQSKPDHDRYEQVAHDLGMCVPRSYEEHYSLLPQSFLPSEFEPRSVLHSMLALIGGFSWSPLRRRHRVRTTDGSLSGSRRISGPENLSRLFDHFTAAALRVHVLRHRAINSGQSMKVIAESAVLMGAISEQIHTEVEALSRHLNSDQMAELPVDRVAFRDTMDAFLFDLSKSSAATKDGGASGTASAARKGAVSFTMSAFMDDDDAGNSGTGDKNNSNSSKASVAINQEALLSALQKQGARQKVAQEFLQPERTSSTDGSFAASPVSPSLLDHSFDQSPDMPALMNASMSARNNNNTTTNSMFASINHFIKQAMLVNLVDPDVPFELMSPEARSVAYDAVFDSIDVRHAGEINWRTFFSALTQASLLPKLGGLVHHPRNLDFSHWIMPVKMREVLSNVHHVVTYSSGNAQVIVGHDAALVMNLPRANAFGAVAPGSSFSNDKKSNAAALSGMNDPLDSATSQLALEREKIDAYFASLRFLTTYNSVKCFVNGVSTAMRVKAEQPMRLAELLARARSVGTQHNHVMTAEQQQKYQRKLVSAAKNLHRRRMAGADNGKKNFSTTMVEQDDELRIMIEDDARRRNHGDDDDDDAFQSQQLLQQGGGSGGGGALSRRPASSKAGSGGRAKSSSSSAGRGVDLVFGDRLTALSSHKQHRLPDPQIVQVLVVEAANVIVVSSTDGTVRFYHIGGSSTLPNCELFFTVSISNTVSAITVSWDGGTIYFGTRHGHIVAMDFPMPQKNLTSSRLRIECLPLRARFTGQVVAKNPLLSTTFKPPVKACKVPNTPYKSYVKQKSEDELAREALRAVQFFDVNLKAQSLPHVGIVSCIIHLEVEHAVLSCSYDHTIMLSCESDLQPLVQYCGHTSGVHKAVHSDDYNFFVSIAFDSRPLVWAVSTQPSKKPPMELHDPVRPHVGTIVDADYIPSSNLIVTLDDIGTVKFWDMRLIHCFETVSVAKFQPTSMSGFSAESGSNTANAKVGGGEDGDGDEGIDLLNLMAMPIKFVGLSLLYEQSSINSPMETLRLFCYTKHHGACVCEWNLRIKERVVRNAAEDQCIVASFLISTGVVNDIDAPGACGRLSSSHSSLNVSGALPVCLTPIPPFAGDDVNRGNVSALPPGAGAPAYEAIELESQILANVTPCNYRTWDVPSGVMRDYFQHEAHATAGGICIGTMNEMRTIIVLGTRDGSVFAHNAQSGTLVQGFRRLHIAQPVQHLACFSYAPQFNLKRNAPRIMIMSLAQRHLHLVVLDTASDGAVMENAGYVATKQAAASAQLTTAMAATALEKGVWLELLNDEEEDAAEMLSQQYAMQMGMRHRVRCFDVNDQIDLVAVGTSHAKVMGFALSAVCASAALKIPIGSIYLPRPRKPKMNDGGDDDDSIQSKISSGDLDAIMLKLFPRIGMGLVVTESSRLCLFSVGCAPLGAAARYCDTAMGNRDHQDSSAAARGAGATSSASGVYGRGAAAAAASSFLSGNDELSPWSLTHVSHLHSNNNSNISSDGRRKLPNHFEPRACWQHVGEAPKKNHLSQFDKFGRRRKNWKPIAQQLVPLPTVVVSPDRLPHLLYVGDEKGFVTLYDLTPIITGVSELPTLVNRWIAHNGGAVVSIFFFAARDKIDAMVGTSGSDQTVHAFSMSGALYFGALDLHQRLSILSVPSFVSDDLGRFNAETHDALLNGSVNHVFMTREVCVDLARELVDRHEDELMTIMARYTPSTTVAAAATTMFHDDEFDHDRQNVDQLSDPHQQHHLSPTTTPQKRKLRTEASISFNVTVETDALAAPRSTSELFFAGSSSSSSPTTTAVGMLGAGEVSLLPPSSATIPPPPPSDADATLLTPASADPRPKSSGGGASNSRQEQMRMMKQKQEEAARQKQENQQRERRKRVAIPPESFKMRAFKLIAEALRRVLLVPRAKSVALPLEHVPWSREAFAAEDAVHIMESLRLSHFAGNEHAEAEADLVSHKKQMREERRDADAALAASIIAAGKEQQQKLRDEMVMAEKSNSIEQQRQRQAKDEEEEQQQQQKPKFGASFVMSSPPPVPKYTFEMSDSDGEAEDGARIIDTPSYPDALKTLQQELFTGSTKATLGSVFNRRGPMTPTPAMASRPPSASPVAARCYSATRRPPSASAHSAGRISNTITRWEKKQNWDTIVPEALKYDGFVVEQQQQPAQNSLFLFGSQSSMRGGGDSMIDASAFLRSQNLSVSFSDNLVVSNSSENSRNNNNNNNRSGASASPQHSSLPPARTQKQLARPPVSAAAKQIMQRAQRTREIFTALESSPVVAASAEQRRAKERLPIVVSKDTVPPGCEDKQQRNNNKAPLDVLLADPRSSALRPEARVLLTKFADMRKATRDNADKPLVISGSSAGCGSRSSSPAPCSMMVLQQTRLMRGPAALAVRALIAAAAAPKNVSSEQEELR